jgi:hypothetical protein
VEVDELVKNWDKAVGRVGNWIDYLQIIKNTEK